MPNLPNLTPTQARVLGCLMEKSVVTPDQYPLTLNALTSACNQKSGRDPVMTLSQADVKHAVVELRARHRHIIQVEENFRTGVERYEQRFCNTTYADFQFDPGQLAIVCLLLLRGPQTPGELRARSGRLHAFDDNTAVVQALMGLIERDGEPLVVKLPRVAGRKDSEYMHLLSGPVDLEEHARRAAAAGGAAGGSVSERISVPELADRIRRLEAEVAALREELKNLR